MSKTIEIFFYFTVAALPLVFVQRAEDAYYLPQFCVLLPSLVFGLIYLLRIREVKKGAAEIGALLFLLFSLPSVFLGPDRIQALMVYAEWLSVFGLYFYSANFLGPGQRKKTLLLMLLSASFSAFYALAQSAGFDLPGWLTDYGGRAFSTFGNPDFFGGFIILVIPLTAGYAFGSGKKKAGLFFAVLFTAALLASRTRSSLAAFVFSAALALWLFRKEIFTGKRALAAISALAVAIVMALFFYSPLRERFTSALDFKNADLQGRFAMWKAGGKMLLDKTFFGVGTTGVKQLFPKYNAGSGYFETERLHNDFIDIAAASGVPALGAFIFLLTAMFIRVRGNSPVSRAAVAAMAAMLCHALLNFPFFIIPSKAYFFLIAGLAAAGREIKPTAQPWIAGVSGLLLCPALIALLGSVYLNTSINALNSRDMNRAGAELGQAMKFYPFAKKYYFAADYSLSARDFEKARQYNRAFCRVYPFAKNGCLQAGIIEGETGDMKAAYAAFDRFLKLYPGDLHALNNRAKAAYMAGDTAAAVRDYERVLQLDPADTVARGNLEAIRGSKFKVQSSK